MPDGSGRLRPLTRPEALRLLGGVAVGRIVFTAHALPAIRPVNHIVDQGAVIIRSHPGAALLSAVDSVVAYEADAVDEQDRVGWSVIITGMARLVTDPDAVVRYERSLRPWMDGQYGRADQVIRIGADLVTGFVLDQDPSPAARPADLRPAPDHRSLPA